MLEQVQQLAVLALDLGLFEADLGLYQLLLVEKHLDPMMKMKDDPYLMLGE